MKDFLKGSLKSKTMWLSAAVSTIGVIESNSDLVNAVLGDNYYGSLMVGVGIASALLRTVTNKSLADKSRKNK